MRATDDEARWLSETDLSDEPIPRRHLAAVRSTVFDVEVDDALRPVLAFVDQPAVAPAPEPDPELATHALLDDLAGRRGVRQPLEESLEDDGEEFEGFGPQHAFDFELPLGTPQGIPAAHPPASRPDKATDAQVLTMPTDRQGRGQRPTGHPSAHPVDGVTDSHPVTEAGPADPDPAARAKPRKGRASVPSWDEIVFGAKPE